MLAEEAAQERKPRKRKVARAKAQKADPLPDAGEGAT
jgi:hypothetical protein